MKIAVLHHADADGFSAAYAAHHALAESHEMLFKAVQYGEEPPYQDLIDFAPDQIYILDFSYKADVLRELMNQFPATVVIDHHKSAAEDLAEFPEIGLAPIARKSPCPCGSEEFSMEVDDMGSCVGKCPPDLPIFSGVRVFQENSGCVLAWLFFNPNEPIPEILHYVQDRDLWKFELEHSKEINAFIATMPWTFEAWQDFYMPLAYDAGKAILAFQARQIEKRVEAAELISFDESEVFVGGDIFGRKDALGVLPCIPLVNASENISELGEALCHAYPDAPFSMTYCDRPGGLRSYSLRSRNGFDVSEVAKAFGGGGHKASSGFTLPAPKII